MGAVDTALWWLRGHQHRDGYWDADGFEEECKLNHCSGKGRADQDRAVTGLSLLAFLGAGETHKHGRYKQQVRAGFKYLKQIQDPDGCFGPRNTEDFLLQHAICTLAMAEIYGLTASPLFKLSAQRGIDFLVASERPDAGAWGRKPGDEQADPATCFFALCALKSARAAGLRVTQGSFDGFMSWLADQTGEQGEVRSAPGSSIPLTLTAGTAAGILGRIFCGEDPRKSAPMLLAASLVRERPPTWDEASPGDIDLHYWYFGTLACVQVGRETWKTWHPNLKNQVIDRQVKDGDEKGSWNPVGPIGKRLGRVGSTALMAMCNQVYYRYAKVFGTR